MSVDSKMERPSLALVAIFLLQRTAMILSTAEWKRGVSPIMDGAQLAWFELYTFMSIATVHERYGTSWYLHNGILC